jgi:hypothetical protein
VLHVLGSPVITPNGVPVVRLGSPRALNQEPCQFGTSRKIAESWRLGTPKERAVAQILGNDLSVMVF